MTTALILAAVVAVANFLAAPLAVHFRGGPTGADDRLVAATAKLYVYLAAFSIALYYASGPVFA